MSVQHKPPYASAEQEPAIPEHPKTLDEHELSLRETKGKTAATHEHSPAPLCKDRKKPRQFSGRESPRLPLP